MSKERLDNLIEIIPGAALKPALFSFDSSLTPVIRTDDIQNNFTAVFTNEKIKSESAYVNNGDLLITFDADLGVAIWNGNRSLFIERVFKIEQKDKRILKKYLFYFLQKQLQLFEVRRAFGAAKRMTVNELKELEVDIPTLEIQHQTVTVLDKAQNVLYKRERSLSLLDQLLRDSFLEMFGEPVSNSKGWDMQEFGQLGSMAINIPKKGPSTDRGMPLIVRSSHVIESSVYIRNFTTIRSDFEITSGEVWPSGTLCITMNSDIGVTGILSFDACITENVAGFIPNEKTNPEFLHFWFLFWRLHVEQKAVKSFSSAVVPKTLQNLIVITPPTQLTDKFRDLVQRVEKVREKMLAAFEQSDSLYQSLLQRAMNGQLEIKSEYDLWLEKGMPATKDISLPEPIKLKKKPTAADIEFRDTLQSGYEFVKMEMDSDEFKKDSLVSSFLIHVDDFLKSLQEATTTTEIKKLLSQFSLPDAGGIDDLRHIVDQYKSVFYEDGTSYGYWSQIKTILDEAREMFKTNHFIQFSDETRRLGEIYLNNIEENERNFANLSAQDEAEEAERQAKEDENLQSEMETDPVLKYIVESENQMYRLIHDHMYNKFTYREILERLEFEENRSYTEEEVRVIIYSTFDHFLSAEFQNQPFTFQQLRTILTSLKLGPSFEVLNDYILDRLQEEDSILQQVYFDEHMGNVNPDSYQYMRDLLNPDLMGDNTFDPPRRVYLIFNPTKIPLRYAS